MNIEEDNMAEAIRILSTVGLCAFPDTYRSGIRVPKGCIPESVLLPLGQIKTRLL
jgi:hypothetical protein